MNKLTNVESKDDFARLLGSGDKIARIRKSSDIREMEKILKEELSWE